MKKRYLIFAFSLLLLNSSIFGQTSSSSMPSLSRLISWVSKTPSQFDLDVRNFGFTFEENEDNSVTSNKTYFRKYTVGNIIWTERLTRIFIKSYNSVTVNLVVGKDVMKIYALERQKLGFVEVDCPISALENESKFCFRTKTYNLTLSDEKKELSSGAGNQYRVIVNKNL